MFILRLVIAMAYAVHRANLTARVSVEESIRRRFLGRDPIVCPGSALHGPSVRGPTGGLRTREVLGHGAAVFLDPVDGDRVGAYELLFMSERQLEPLARWPIGPRVRLDRLPAENCEGMALAFSVHGEAGCAIAFDREVDGIAFVRDFEVRRKLMAVSLQVSRQTRAGAIRSNIRGQRGGLCWMLLAVQRWVARLLVLFFLAMAARTAVLAQDQSLLGATGVAIQEGGAALSASTRAATRATATACTMLGASGVLPGAVAQCVEGDDADAIACVRALLNQRWW